MRDDLFCKHLHLGKQLGRIIREKAKIEVPDTGINPLLNGLHAVLRGAGNAKRPGYILGGTVGRDISLTHVGHR